MTCVSLFGSSDGSWTLYEGMDAVPSNQVSEHDSESAALRAAKRENKDVILVVESDELAGYTRKLEASGLDYEEV